jgi:hypothetical protein
MAKFTVRLEFKEQRSFTVRPDQLRAFFEDLKPAGGSVRVTTVRRWKKPREGDEV